MANDSEKESHPSWGVVTISRVYGGSKSNSSLFGVNTPTDSYIEMRVHQASVYSGEIYNHNLKGHTIIPDTSNPLLTIALSPTQWGQLVCSIGIGEGTPCTIRKVANQSVGFQPYIIHSVQKARQHMKKVIDNLSGVANGPMTRLIERVNDLPISQKKKDEILKDLGIVSDHFKSNTEYVMDEFTEHADKVAVELYNNILAAGTNAILDAGTKRMQTTIPAFQNEVHGAIEVNSERVPRRIKISE